MQISALCFGLLTVFIDENLYQNSASLTGSQHFHGFSVTVLQFLTVSQQGLNREMSNF